VIKNANPALWLTGQDPLSVGTESSCRCKGLEQQNPGFGFGPPSTKPGFEYQCKYPWSQTPTELVDGLRTPHIRFLQPLPKEKLNLNELSDAARLKNTKVGKNAAQSAVEQHGPGPIERGDLVQNRIRTGDDVALNTQIGMAQQNPAAIQMGVRQFAAQGLVQFQATHQKGMGLVFEFQNRADAGKAWNNFAPGYKLNVARGTTQSFCTLTGLPAGLWRVRARNDVAGAQWSNWSEFSVQGTGAGQTQMNMPKQNLAPGGMINTLQNKNLNKK
jgi:hypothetical protein